MSDPGLQAQRTALAWSRTALAMSVSALLVLRSGLRHADMPLLIVGVGCCLLAGGMGMVAVQRRRQLGHAGVTAPPTWVMALAAMSVLLAGLGSFLAIVAGAP